MGTCLVCIVNPKSLEWGRCSQHWEAVRIKTCFDTSVSLQYFIGVTVLAMVPELPEIVNGIQFALQNNLSLR